VVDVASVTDDLGLFFIEPLVSATYRLSSTPTSPSIHYEHASSPEEMFPSTLS
jgi:hypothetical protein